MRAAETQQGLLRLGILQEMTLTYSPYQNGKQENFWGRVEGRLMAMLENLGSLSLGKLNEATLAWVEREYNREVHSETKQTPIDRFLDGPTVGRPCPSWEALQEAFTQEEPRTQRRSDGTLTVGDVRFELPGDHDEKIAVPAAGARSTVIEVWSPTCESCKDRVSALVSHEMEIQQKGAKLVLVAVLSEGEAAEDAGKTLASWGVRAHPFAIDKGEVIRSRLGVNELPATVILSGDKLRWVAPTGAEMEPNNTPG